MKINGTTVPSPIKMDWSLQDLSSDSSGRDLNGLMYKDKVAQKRKLACTWPPMRWAEASALLRAVSADVFFTCTYPDLMSGTDETRTFYVGDRKAAQLLWADNEQWVHDLAFDLIER